MMKDSNVTTSFNGMTEKEKKLANEYLQNLRAEMFIRFWDKEFVNAIINSITRGTKKVDVEQIEYKIALKI